MEQLREAHLIRVCSTCMQNLTWHAIQKTGLKAVRVNYNTWPDALNEGRPCVSTVFSCSIWSWAKSDSKLLTLSISSTVVVRSSCRDRLSSSDSTLVSSGVSALSVRRRYFTAVTYTWSILMIYQINKTMISNSLVKSKSVASFKYNLKSIDLSSFLNYVF